MSVTSRFPGLFLLAIMLIAAGLLIADYGAEVGVGIIVGLILGGAAVLAIVAGGSAMRSSSDSTPLCSLTLCSGAAADLFCATKAAECASPRTIELEPPG